MFLCVDDQFVSVKRLHILLLLLLLLLLSVVGSPPVMCRLSTGGGVIFIYLTSWTMLKMHPTSTQR